MTLADLLADPQRAAELEPDQARALLPQLGGLVVILSARLNAANGDHVSINGDTMLTVQEVADLVRQDRAWVWRRARREDWKKFIVKPSRKVLLVRRAELLKWLARHGRKST